MAVNPHLSAQNLKIPLRIDYPCRKMMFRKLPDIGSEITWSTDIAEK